MSVLVSIVIPCFNSEAWVAAAIRSALLQTHRPIEVIVVDDGSTDTSLQVIKSFGDSIRVLSGPRAGGCAARNLGIEAARGDLIQFLDSDDELTPTCISDKLPLSQDPQVVICSDVELMSISNQARHTFWHRERFALTDMLRFGSPSVVGPLHERQCLLSIGGFREGLGCAQEYDLHLRLSIECGITFVSNHAVGALIRPHEGSLSRRAGVKMFDGIRDVLNHALSRLSAEDALLPDHRDAAAQHLTRLAKRLWRNGERSRAADFAQEARALSPQWYKGCYRGPLEAYVASCVGFEMYERLTAMILRNSAPRPREIAG